MTKIQILQVIFNNIHHYLNQQSIKKYQQMEADTYRSKQLKFTYSEFLNRRQNMENMVVDKYVIYDLIGKGGFGNVYRGMNDVTKRQVAVKVINIRQINLQTNPTVKAIKMRLAESQPKMMQTCNSPYLLKCYDVYQNADLKILILEYCNGKTLQQEIDERGKISESQAVIILRHIINGLMEMHKHKIVHRDLKADNIMSHNGTYKIIDFGFSKKLQITQEMSEVKGTSLGSLTTMAPEVMSKQAYGLKADIWSLGIIFFQMIYGIYPYDSKQAFQRYKQIKNKKLFADNTPMTVNKITPSQQAYDFLRFIIVVETKQRPNWKQVSEHPLIKNINDESINQRFLKICEVVVDEKLNCDEEIENGSSNLNMDKIVQEWKKKDQESFVKRKAEGQLVVQTINHTQKQQKQQKQKPINAPKQQVIKTSPKMLVQQKVQQKEIPLKKHQNQVQPKDQKDQMKDKQKIKPEQNKINILGKTVFKIQTGQKKQPIKIPRSPKESIEQKKLEIDQSQEDQYEWTRTVHLECLKTQYIYRQIIKPMQVGKILKDNRNTVEFMYLLISRCFNNMSPVHFQLETRNRNTELIKNLCRQIDPLYKQVYEKFLQLSEALTKVESKVLSIVSDRLSKIFFNSSLKTKDKFLVGIEGEEYTKIQQICYTKNYYQQHIRENLKSTKVGISTIKKLDCYIDINEITTETIRIKKKDFEAIVKDILSKSPQKY